MREDTRGEWEEGIRRCGALEVLKACCEVGTGRTPGPSDVAEERSNPPLRKSQGAAADSELINQPSSAEH
jgi:hypothetical protein